MIRLLFADGSFVSGKSFREVEDSLRASQWTTYKSRAAFREDMRKRAKVWNGADVLEPAGRESSAHFIQSLGEAGLYLIVREESES